MKKLMLLTVFIPIIMSAQYDLTVHVENIKNTNGEIRVAIYDKAAGFLKFDKVFKAAAKKAIKGKTTLVLKDIPSGTYALAVFHDENSNEKLDTNFMGIPKEPLGFSMAKMKTFGPPSFEECSFKLSGVRDITIEIK